jgi:hypothetical protein
MTQTRLCPICRHPLQEDAEHARYRPFCSKRCADVDLGRWLKNQYAIPAVEAETEEDAERGAKTEH